MKVLQILTELGPGGAERVCLDLSSGLVARGHSVHVISLKSPSGNRTMDAAFRRAGIIPEYLGMDSASGFMRIFQLRKMIRKIHPDLIHSHLMHPNLVSRFAAFGMRIPLVNTIHIAERRSGQGIFFLLDRLTFRLASVCTAVSYAAAEFHEKKLGLRRHTIFIIYNGVDRVKPASIERLRAVKAAWGVAGCRKIIGSIGRLDPQKGFDRLLKLLPFISKSIPKGETWAVVLIGEGPERKRLEALAKENMPQNIVFRMPGFRADAAMLMAQFDLFVMPSRYEGYGLAFAEAMTLGLPAVVNGVDSLEELGNLYSNASLVDFENPGKYGKIAETVLECVQKKRVGPVVISSKSEMVSRYLELFRKFVPGKGTL